MVLINVPQKDVPQKDAFLAGENRRLPENPTRRKLKA